MHIHSFPLSCYISQVNKDGDAAEDNNVIIITIKRFILRDISTKWTQGANVCDDDDTQSH
jgi:hypothetical protein